MFQIWNKCYAASKQTTFNLILLWTLMHLYDADKPT